MKLIECPRDAMQGVVNFIPTAKKIEYINALLKVGFDTIDFGSFVSPKIIPQMRDTDKVLRGLNIARMGLGRCLYPKNDRKTIPDEVIKNNWIHATFVAI